MPTSFLMRKLHDFHSLARHCFGTRLRKLDVPPANHLLSQATVQQAGSGRITHALEQHLFGDPQSSSSFSWPEITSYHLKDVFSTGRDGNVFFTGQDLLAACPWVRRSWESKIRRPLPMLAKPIPQPLFHLTGRNHENHGHFLFQHLPRLIAARQCMPGDTSLLVAKSHTHWQGTYLEMLGVDRNKLITTNDGTLLCTDLHYVPILSGTTPLCSVEIFKALVAHFQETISRKRLQEQAKRYDAIFVSRADAPDRRLLNEKEVFETTRHYFPNSLLVKLKGASLQEQIRCFNAADVVIGEAGMGLSNILFVKNKILVVLNSDNRDINPGWELTYADIAALSGNLAVRVHSGLPRLQNRDWTFPVEVYRNFLARLVPVARKLGCLRQPPA
jgi:capsular polysaccharide biosynthesis protein